MEVRLLGPVVAEVDGDRLAIGGYNQVALLAMLALDAPDFITAARIGENLWPDTPPRDLEGAVQVVVSRVRKAIGASALVTEPAGYRLAIPPESIDLFRFRRLAARARRMLDAGSPAGAIDACRQALAHWRGHALGNIERFDFAARAAMAIEDERMAVVEMLMDAELAAGNHSDVIGDLVALVEDQPLRERLWELLMLALYRSGRQAEALRAFSRLRSILGEELGVEPSPALSALEERILLQDPGLEIDPTPASEVHDEPPSEVIRFAPGETIIEEGSKSDTVYWVEDGRVEIYRARPTGDEFVAEVLAGRYFGELAGLLGMRRTASARATTVVTLSAMSVEEFRRRLMDPERSSPL